MCPADRIIECTERSLKSFDTDFIDLQHFHVWVNEWTDNEELIKAVERLKKDGKIRAVGVAVNHPYGKDDNAVPGMESGSVAKNGIRYQFIICRPDVRRSAKRRLQAEA
jgi:diketogulonate reductase-like aldo/keto reductase